MASRQSTINKAWQANILSAQGRSDQDIADDLGVSPRRVKEEYLQPNTHGSACPVCHGKGINRKRSTGEITPICSRKLMSRKIRELKAQIKREGFIYLPKRGKGSHERWRHPLLTQTLTISGKDGDDVPVYLEKQVSLLLTELQSLKESDDS